MIIILLGQPGSGKGSQAEILKKHFNIPHISTGDMFRKAIKEETKVGLKAKEYTVSGRLVPDEITNELVKERLLMPDMKNGFILDGYPRNINQAQELLQFLKENNLKLDCVLNINSHEEEIIFRITGRRVCSFCGKLYHIVNMKPKVEGICDLDQKPLLHRPDDTKEVIKDRLLVYQKETEPLVSFFKKIDHLLIDVDGSGELNDVTKRIFSLLEGKHDSY